MGDDMVIKVVAQTALNYPTLMPHLTWTNPHVKQTDKQTDKQTGRNKKAKTSRKNKTQASKQQAETRYLFEIILRFEVFCVRTEVTVDRI